MFIFEKSTEQNREKALPFLKGQRCIHVALQEDIAQQGILDAGRHTFNTMSGMQPYVLSLSSSP